MMYGELKKQTEQYQLGHRMGSTRAYDDAIAWFEKIKRNEKKGQKYSIDETIAMLKACKDIWLEFCDSFGMGDNEDDR